MNMTNWTKNVTNSWKSLQNDRKILYHRSGCYPIYLYRLLCQCLNIHPLKFLASILFNFSNLCIDCIWQDRHGSFCAGNNDRREAMANPRSTENYAQALYLYHLIFEKFDLSHVTSVYILFHPSFVRTFFSEKQIQLGADIYQLRGDKTHEWDCPPRHARDKGVIFDVVFEGLVLLDC